MATFTITNLTSADIYIGDFYATCRVGTPLVLTNRSVDEVPGLRVTQEQLALGNISFSITPTTDEEASGLMAPTNSVQAQDFQRVAAGDAAAPVQVFFKAFAAGAGGAPDDVTIFAANALPYKMRILDVIGFVSVNIATHTVDVQDEAAGAGTAAASLDYGAATGRVVDTTVTGTTVYDVGATKGLFLYRSDSGVAGEVLIYARRES